MGRTTVNRHIHKLEQNGLITAAPSGEDPRRTLIRVGPRCRARLEVASPAWKRAQRSVKERSGEGDFQQPYPLPDKIAEAPGHAAPPFSRAQRGCVFRGRRGRTRFRRATGSTAP